MYFDVVRVPDAVWKNGLASQTAMNSYLLDTLGYDCVLDASVVTPEGLAYHQFLPAHQTYGYAVVGDTPVSPRQDALAALFTWVKPFSPGVWGLIVVAFVVSSFLMTIFERGHSLELWDIADFGPRDGTPAGRLNFVVHGTYIAISSFTSQNCEMFVANSVSGRMYRTMYSFFIMLSCSCYVANLAAVLSTPTSKTALVDSIHSFGTRNIKACVLNRTDDLAFMAANHPEVTLNVVNSGNEEDMLPLILASACGGAVGRNSALNFLLGPVGDPGGSYCTLSQAGSVLSVGYHAVAFSRRFPLQRLSAMSGLVSAVVNDGSYVEAMGDEASFPLQRTNCATSAGVLDTSGSLELSIVEFSGVFVILALGGLICMVVHFMQRATRQKRLARMSSGPIGGCESHKPVMSSGILGRRASGTIQIPQGGFPEYDSEMSAREGSFGGPHDSHAHMSKRLARHAAGVHAARAHQAKANLELQSASAQLEERLRAAAADMQDLEDMVSMLGEKRSSRHPLSRNSSGNLMAMALESHPLDSHTHQHEAPAVKIAVVESTPESKRARSTPPKAPEAAPQKPPPSVVPPQKPIEVRVQAAPQPQKAPPQSAPPPPKAPEGKVQAALASLQKMPPRNPSPQQAPPAPVVVAAAPAAQSTPAARVVPEETEVPRLQDTPPQDTPPSARANGSAPAGRRGASTDSASSNEEPLPPPPVPHESGSGGIRIDPRTGRRIPKWDIRL